VKSAILIVGILFACFSFVLGCKSDQSSQETFTRELSSAESPSPSVLMKQAQTAKTPDQKLALFQHLIAAYPDSPQADDAQFMLGFVLLENMGRKKDAQAAFEILFEKYPDSEWIDDAKSIMAPEDSTASSP